MQKKKQKRRAKDAKKEESMADDLQSRTYDDDFNVNIRELEVGC
jgi:hypothetical protein